jgi:hypothetical protein
LPKIKTKVVKANGTSLIFDTVIGKDYRVSIPTIIRGSINIKKTVRVTVENILEEKKL